MNGTESRVKGRGERAWWRLYENVRVMADAGITLEASSVRYLMDRLAQEEHLRGVERGELVGVTKEEVSR